MIPDPNPFKFKYHCRMCGVIFEQKFDEPAWENGLSFIHPIYEDGDFDKLKDILFSLGQGISIEGLNGHVMRNHCVHKCSNDCYGMAELLGAQRQR